MKPRVSVVMPVRNAAPYVGIAVRSILRQSLTDFELIVVDDASSDDTLARIEDAAADDPRVRVLSAQGTGLGAALNRGWRAARAPLVARMDGDDAAHRDRLRRQVTFLEDDLSVGVVACRVRSFPRKAI